MSWIGAILLLCVAVAHASLPQNAYINRKVTSVDDLVLHVTTDPEVFSHYSRHFSMDREELIAYLGSLKMSTIPRDGLYVVYNVPKTGELRAKARVLKKGTPVFANSKGVPILMVICGNPLTRGPKKDSVMVSYNEPNTDIATNIAEVPVDLEGEYSETMATVVAPEYHPVETIPSAVYAPPTVTGGGSDIAIIPGGSFPWQVLPALGLVGAVGSHGGSTPVPEPATIAILAVGASTLILKRRNKKNS